MRRQDKERNGRAIIESADLPNYNADGIYRSIKNMAETLLLEALGPNLYAIEDFTTVRRNFGKLQIIATAGENSVSLRVQEGADPNHGTRMLGQGKIIGRESAIITRPNFKYVDLEPTRFSNHISSLVLSNLLRKVIMDVTRQLRRDYNGGSNSNHNSGSNSNSNTA
jgi:hypothetical protein